MPAPVRLEPDRELEDGEIATLNEIVARASATADSDTHPWRALHSAYLDVLGHHEVDENPDSIYLRFLFLLRERQVQNPIPTLYAHFQQLLRENGIEIQPVGSSSVDLDEYEYLQADGQEYDDYDEAQSRDGGYAPKSVKSSPGEVTIALERFGRPADEVAQAAREWMPVPRRQRRASLESVFRPADVGEENKHMRRRASFSQITEDTRPLSPGPVLTTVGSHPPRPWEASMIANAPLSSPEVPAAKRPTRPRPHSQITLLDEPEDLADIALLLKGERQQSRRQEQLRPAAQLLNSQPVGLRRSRELPVESKNLQNLKAVPHRRDIPIKTIDVDPEPDLSRLQTTAVAFDRARTHELIREILHRWSDSAVQLFEYQQQQEHRAARWDAEQLKRDSFRAWYQAVRDIRQYRAEKLAEERHFALLEQRAVDVRDTNLLAKALRHWAACAAEETEHVKRAKEHLLRLRYFNLWKAYSVTNEQKVMVPSLRRWITTWHNCTARLAKAELGCDDYYDDVLVRRFFRRWALIVSERRVEKLRDTRLKRSAFEVMIRRHSRSKENHQMVTQARQRAALETLERRHLEHTENAALALEFDHKRVLHLGFSTLAQQQRLYAQGRYVVSAIDWRIARDAFSSLRKQLSLEQRAKDFDRKRIMKHWWTQWNGQLRENALAKKINTRLLTQALYRWVIAERGRLFERLHTERLMQRCLIHVVDHWSEQSSGLAEAFLTFKRYQKELLLRSALHKWTTRSASVSRLEGVAVALRHQTLKEKGISAFVENYQRIATLELDYLPNAELFFRGKSSIKLWKEATKKSKKVKRHEAYSTIRRQAKQKLALKCITLWRERLLVAQEQQASSVTFQAENLSSLVSDIFKGWRERLQNLRNQESQAAQTHKTQLTRRALDTLQAKNRRVADNLAVALEHDSEHAKRAAYLCLRKLHFRIGSIQDLYTSRRVADQIQWSRRRYCRHLLRVWLDTTLRKRGIAADVPVLLTTRTGRFRNLLGQSQLRESLAARVVAPADDNNLPRDKLSVTAQATSPDGDNSMTPAIPPPSTPSRRRFARSMRTPAQPVPKPSSVPVAAPVRAAEAWAISADRPWVPAAANPFASSAPPATESRLRQTRPFGRSTARALFNPIHERVTESFPQRPVMSGVSK